jgi:hypothetical protein
MSEQIDFTREEYELTKVSDPTGEILGARTSTAPKLSSPLFASQGGAVRKESIGTGG